MIWDEVRKQAPRLRRPEIQVIKSPCLLSEDSGILPKSPDGKIDMSWVKYPYEEFVIVGSEDQPFCLFVTCTQTKDIDMEQWSGEERICAERNSSELDWSFNAYLIFKDARVGICMGACGIGLIRKDGGLIAAPERLLADTSATGGSRFIVAKKAEFEGLQSLFIDDPDSNREIVFSVAATLSLLSCKNVSKELKHPPRQQRRAAERSGLPLVSWHELVVTNGGGSSHGSGVGQPLALHWVRGHFKDYREKGLFGSQKAVYWWSPHLAGQADRVVLKDYKIAEPAAPN